MTEDSCTPELDALLGAAVDAIVISDGSGRILRCNAAAHRLFGHDDGTLEGQAVSILMPEAEAARHDGYMHHHLATGERRIIGTGREMEGRRRDGTQFPLHLSIGRSETPTGPVFVAILHDLTQRRAAQEMAERIHRLGAIGEMSGGIAHDFNNILTLVIGNLELATHREVTPDVRGLIENALEAAELGADLTARLLAFARQSSLMPQRITVNEAVNRAVTLIRQQLGDGHRVDLSLDAGAGEIDVDGPQLQSALLNLLRNAGDAMEEPGVILVRTEKVAVDDAFLARETDLKPGHYVRISVSDTGSGMTEEVRRRAFQPFFTTKPPGRGTGLGLASTHGFVRQSGGHVTLYSEARQGTTVSLYLPAPGREPQAEAARPALSGRGQAILVVEDDAALRRMTGERLAALGYAPVVVGGVEAALAVLDKGTHVDLVFTDIVLRDGRSGIDLARELRRVRPDLPVLMTTGYAGEMVDTDLVNGLPLIRKPYRQEELAAAIHRALAVGATPIP